MNRRRSEPRQRPGQEPLERIRIAAEELLRKAGTLEVRIREFCSLAGVSPSSFCPPLPEAFEIRLIDWFTLRFYEKWEHIRASAADSSPSSRL